MSEPYELGAAELRRLFLRRELSPTEALESCAARIEETARFNAFTVVAFDEAREAARAAERAYAAGDGEARPLRGVPVAVKDAIDTAGLQTTYGSAMFARHVPTRDAACVARLRAAGAVIVGKTSLFELAWGITSSNALHGDCLNPWDPARSAGGSSGGSAAALALRQVPLTLGTDTGGSIRIPAAWCGVMGLKPTFGRVATEGVFPLAPSLDHVGPMARRPEDLALAMTALGAEPLESFPPGGGRAAVWEGPPGPELDTAGRDALEAAGAALARAGWAVEPVDEPALDGAVHVFATIQGVEALATHRELGLYPERREEYPPEIGRRLDRAREIDPRRYEAAQEARRALLARLDELLGRFDVLVSPVAPLAAPSLGAEGEVVAGAARGVRAAVLPYTVPHNLAGVPAAAVRTAVDRDGLPRAVQVSAARGRDAAALAASAVIWADDPGLQTRWPSALDASAVRDDPGDVR